MLLTLSESRPNSSTCLHPRIDGFSSESTILKSATVDLFRKLIFSSCAAIVLIVPPPYLFNMQLLGLIFTASCDFCRSVDMSVQVSPLCRLST